MPRKLLTQKWTDEDAAKLVELSKAGATLARAAGALSRNTSSVQKKGRELVGAFPGVRAVREALRKSGAIEIGRRHARS